MPMVPDPGMVSTVPAARPIAGHEAPPIREEARQGVLHAALLESRQRWRELVQLTADLAFETDAQGRFVFVAPDNTIGWSAALLVGQPAALLLADSAGMIGFDPFRPTVRTRGRRAWLKRPDGSPVCLVFSAAPILDAQGQVIGARGIGQDITEQDLHESRLAATLRRSQVVEHILTCMHQEVHAARMMKAALGAMVTAVGAEGCVVIDLLGDGVQAEFLHQIGLPPAAVVHTAMSLLEANPSGQSDAMANDGRWTMVCPAHTSGTQAAALAIWRGLGGRPWDADDRMLATSVNSIIRVVLQHEAMQRDITEQARTDPLTGLFNRRAFLDEMGRRLDRLSREGQPGTILFIDLDGFKQLNDQRGHDVGDEALCLVADMLRDTVRPSDLVARLGGDEFAIWMDGADDLTAAERAEHLTIVAPRAMRELAGGHDIRLGMSIGIATRWPGIRETLDETLQRADQAMYQAKRAGRGQWAGMAEGGDVMAPSAAPALLAHPAETEAVRVRLGAAPDTAPDILRELAIDPSVTVRAAVAMNPAAGGDTDHMLAHDQDERVRTLLARKLASLVPGLTASDQAALRERALATLHRLVNDEAVRVRHAMADVLKDMPLAPRSIILVLARDSATQVFDPVVRLSPILSSEDLLALLSDTPGSDVAISVASRPNLSEDVADAVASSSNVRAVTALLTNSTAAIREATLDMLAAEGAPHEAWHHPLAARPRLSERAARALSDYVATHLLDMLAGRADLPVATARELRQRLEVRLNPPQAGARRDPDIEQAMQEARQLQAQHGLDEAALLAAVQRGEPRMATAILAVAAEVPASVVDRAATLRSAKGLISLVWKAGFSMQIAVPLQTLLARLNPATALRPTPGGGFPLAVDEMRWQIDFLRDMGR